MCMWQADDRKFKEELGRVIEMEVWDSAKAVAADRLRAAKGEGGKLEHELTVRQGWLQNLREQVIIHMCYSNDLSTSDCPSVLSEHIHALPLALQACSP